MTKRRQLLLGGMTICAGLGMLRPAYSSDSADANALETYISKVAVSDEGVRLQHAPANRASLPAAGAHCNSLPAMAPGGTRMFRFADGNTVAFPADGSIEFVTQARDRRQVSDTPEVRSLSWWCEADGLVLFRTVPAPGGQLGGVRVEWFDSQGTQKTATELRVPPSDGRVNWEYEGARVVDDCLGLTLRVQQGRAWNPAKPAQFVEYKLCPVGI